MRERFPVEWICERARDLAEHAETDAVKLRALEIIAERGHGKVVDRLEITPGTPDEDDDDLPDDPAILAELHRAELEHEERRRMILARPALALASGNG